MLLGDISLVPTTSYRLCITARDSCSLSIFDQYSIPCKPSINLIGMIGFTSHYVFQVKSIQRYMTFQRLYQEAFRLYPYKCKCEHICIIRIVHEYDDHLLYINVYYV